MLSFGTLPGLSVNGTSLVPPSRSKSIVSSLLSVDRRFIGGGGGGGGGSETGSSGALRVGGGGRPLGNAVLWKEEG